MDRYLDAYDQVPPSSTGDFIKVWSVDQSFSQKINVITGEDVYVVWAVSIMSREFFFRVLSMVEPLPNRWPRHLPFDFEKKAQDFPHLSIRTAFPQREMFASIDDDHTQEGYSLISRGLYNSRISRSKLKQLEFSSSKSPLTAMLRRILRLLSFIPKI